MPKDSSRYSTPAAKELIKNIYSPQLEIEKAQSIDQFCSNTKCKLLEMNKLRLECNELLKSASNTTEFINSRNYASKSFAEKKRRPFDCHTERVDGESYNINSAQNAETTKPVHTANEIECSKEHSILKLPKIGTVLSNKSSSINFVMRPKLISVVKGQPIFSIRKKAIDNSYIPQNMSKMPLNLSYNIQSKIHFLNRVAEENKVLSGKASPARYYSDADKGYY